MEEAIKVKKKKEKGDTGKYLKKKWYLFLILFLTIFAGVLLGYISGPIQRDVSTTKFILCGVSLILLAMLDMFIILKIRLDMKHNKKISPNLMFYFFFISIFASGLILTIAFRLLAMNDPNNILNKGNLISLICSLSYLLLLALAVFFPLEKQTQEVIKEETKIEENITTDVVNEATPIETYAAPIEETKTVTVAPTIEEAPTIETPVEVKPKVIKKIIRRKQPQGLTKQDIIDIIKDSGIEEAIREEVRANQKENEEPLIKPIVFNGQVMNAEEFANLFKNENK